MDESIPTRAAPTTGARKRGDPNWRLASGIQAASLTIIALVGLPAWMSIGMSPTPPDLGTRVVLAAVVAAGATLVAAALRRPIAGPLIALLGAGGAISCLLLIAQYGGSNLRALLTLGVAFSVCVALVGLGALWVRRRTRPFGLADLAIVAIVGAIASLLIVFGERIFPGR